MYSISLGNSTEAEGSLTVKGLPPLELDVGKGGYLDGYVVSAKSLRKMYLTRNYENIFTVAMSLSYEQHKKLDQFRTGSLAALQLLNSWARVQILKRIGIVKVSVYFVDTGLEQDVNINNLYVLPAKLRNKPPLAIPIYMNSEAPEVDYDELQKLRGAKVAVKLDGKGPENTIYGSEFTVFERNSHNNLEIVEALKDPQFELDRANVNGKRVLPQMKQGALVNDTSSTSTAAVTTTAAPKEDNVTVLVVTLVVVSLVVAAIIVAVLFIVRKIRQARRAEQQQQQQPAAETGESEDRNSQRVTQRVTDSESERVPVVPHRTPELGPDTHPAVIPLQADSLAVVTAAIALANYEIDRESSVTLRKHKSPTALDGLTGNVLTISTDKRVSAGGESEISSIDYDISPGLRCSTPLAQIPPVFTPLRPARQPVWEPVVDRSQEAVLPPLPNEPLVDVSSYSDILDVRQFVSRNILERTIYLPDETTYMTAPDSPDSRDNRS